MSQPPITEPGIRGWLIVLTILLFGSPGNFIAHAEVIARDFEKPIVRQFTNPSSPLFDAHWQMYVFSETTGFLILGYVSMLILWPLFCLRHHLFRFAFAFVALGVASLLVLRAALASLIPTIVQPNRFSIYTQTAFWLPVSLALAVYVIRSRRAQLTFRRRLLFYPAFPFFIRT